MVRPGGCGWDVPHVARPQTKSQAGEGEEPSPPTGSLKEHTSSAFLCVGLIPAKPFLPDVEVLPASREADGCPPLYEEETEAQRQQATAQGHP